MKNLSLGKILIIFLICNNLTGIIINLATNVVPESIKPYLWFSWIALPIVVIAQYFIQRKFREKESEESGKSKISHSFLEKQKIEVKIAALTQLIEKLTDELNENTNHVYKFTLATRLKGLHKKIDVLKKQLIYLKKSLQSHGGDVALEIQEFLKLAGWNVSVGEMKPLNANKVEFYIEGIASNSDCLVHYVPGSADFTDVQDLEQALETKNIAQGWLITERFYDPMIINTDKISLGKEDGNKKISVFDVNYLYFNKLFSINGYRTWLEKECREKRVSQYNVPIDGDIPTYANTGEEIESRHINSVDDYVDKWIKSKGENHISIWGDFGTGKSWFCWQYANKQLKKYLDNPGTERIPIMIPLCNFADQRKFERLIEEFCKNYNIHFRDNELFNAFNQAGKFLIIFDGLDEIVVGNDESHFEAVFEKLMRFMVPNSKIILTARRTLFKNSRERRNLLETHKSRPPSKQRLELFHYPNFEAIRLKKFDTNRIKDFIRKRYPKSCKKFWEQLSAFNTNNLLELANRPIMLEIILDVFKENIFLNKFITTAELYKIYTDRLLEKVSRTNNLLSKEDRRRVMQILAWKMYESGKSEIHYKFLPELLEDLNEQILDLRESESGRKTEFLTLIKRLAEAKEKTTLPLYECELRTKSFLVRNPAGYYFFAHKSFLEYFVAQKLCMDLKEKRREAFTKYPLSHEIIDFLKDLDFPLNIPLQWLREYRREQPHLHGNLLTLLNKKRVDLKNLDLSQLYIVNADLCGANLEGCNFTGSTFEKVNLRDSVLKNTNFTGAKLHGLVLGVRSPAKGVAFSPNSKYIVSSRADNAVVLFGKDGDEWVEQKELFGHQDSVTNVAFNNTGKWIASSSFDKTVRLWKLNSKNSFALPKHEDTIYDIEFLSSNKPTGNDFHVFTASGRSIKLWQIKETALKDFVSEELTTHTEHKDMVYKLTISQDGEYLASASFDETVGLWKIKSTRSGIDLELVKFFKNHKNLVNGVAFSPDSRFLASSSNDKCILIWSLANMELKERFNAHTEIVWDINYSQSGKFLVSGSSDNTVKIWNVNTHEFISLEGHTANVWSVCFSPDEKFVVSGSFDNTVKIWDWRNKRCIQTLQMGEAANQNIDCTGMKINCVEGLSSFQEMFLMQLGAVKE
jgi:WD40 repeat protein